MALKPLTSDSMTLEIAHTAELSLAELTSLPVEIIDCVLDKSLLIDLSVCSATIALLLVRMLDIKMFLWMRRFAPIVFRNPQKMRLEASF